MRTLFLLALISLFSFSSCYTFKDISIKPDVKTFFIEDFSLNTNAPGNINLDFSEELKRRVLLETRLSYDEINPHIIFEGSVNRFAVVSTATDAQNTASLNKLEIQIKIKYTNILHEDENWESSFSDYSNFSRDENLADVQDDLISEIFDQIIESVINRSFSNW
jgi:hypothetical protein